MGACDITLKDLLVLTKDKRALVLLLLLPLMFIAIIGMSTGQFLTRDDDSELFKIALVDESHSDMSKDLLAELRQRPELVITPVESQDAAADVLRRGDASVILVVGPHFEEKVDEVRLSDVFNADSELTTAGPSSLDLSVEAKPNGVGRLLEAVLFSQIVRYVATVAAQKNPITRSWVRSQDTDDSAIAAKAAAAAAENRTKQNGVYLWVVPGFTVMFAFFLISIMARSFIIERDQGTLRRLLMAPIGSWQVLVGKTMPFYLTSVLQIALLFICGRLLFGMPWGTEPLFLIPVILCTSAAATSLGLLLSTLVHSDQQVSSYGTALILILSSISGCFFPREFFPKIMKQISLFTPHAWALKAFDGVLSQPIVDGRMIGTCCAMLLVFTAIFFTTGWWRFRANSHG